VPTTSFSARVADLLLRHPVETRARNYARALEGAETNWRAYARRAYLDLIGRLRGIPD